MNKAEKREKIELYADWLVTSPETRELQTQKALAEFLGVTEQTLVTWKGQLSETDALDEIQRFRRQVFNQAMKPNASAKHMELYARLKGLLIDKSEMKVEIGLTADEITRRNFEADRELQEWDKGRGKGGQGLEEMPKEYSLLPE